MLNAKDCYEKALSNFSNQEDNYFNIIKMLFEDCISSAVEEGAFCYRMDFNPGANKMNYRIANKIVNYFVELGFKTSIHIRDTEVIAITISWDKDIISE